MEGATVAELLAAVRPLITSHAAMPVVLRHEVLGDEPLTDVELRSASGALVDLYSGTVSAVHTIETLARSLARLTSQGAATYEVNIFHPGSGSEPVVEISSDGQSLILTT